MMPHQTELQKKADILGHLYSRYVDDIVYIQPKAIRLASLYDVLQIAKTMGKRGPVTKTLVKKYGLTLDEALTLRGRDRAWRRIF